MKNELINEMKKPVTVEEIDSSLGDWLYACKS